MKPINTRLCAAVALLPLLAGARASAQDAAAAGKPTPRLHVLRPVPSAIVREDVKIRVAPRDIPADSYVGVTIDGVFRTARVISAAGRKSGVVFDWDTKAAYTTSDDPDTPKLYADGDHTLKIDMFDRSGNVEGEAIIPVRVANKIIVPAQGIKLAYHWSASLQLHYLRQSQLDSVPDTPGSAVAVTPQNLEASLIRYSRSVEDASSGDYLVRDTVLPNSFLISRGQTQRLEAAYQIKSKYRTVDARGNVLRESAPLSPGRHLGFSIPILPARRVAVGDSWQAPVQITFDWAGNPSARVTAESRLEGFEWQNGYPSAKIRETFSGPVTFKSSPGNVTAFDAQTVKYERVIFFAYGSGRLVHTETKMDITADLTSSAISGLGLGGGAGAGGFGGPPPGFGGPPPGFGGPGGSPYGNLLNGDPEDQGGPPQGPGGYPGGGPGGYPGGGPGGYPGGGPGGYPGGGPGGYPGGGPGGYPGGGPGGYPGGGYPSPGAAGTPQSTATKLKVTDITNLVPGYGDYTSRS